MSCNDDLKTILLLWNKDMPLSECFKEAPQFSGKRKTLIKGNWQIIEEESVFQQWEESDFDGIDRIVILAELTWGGHSPMDLYGLAIFEQIRFYKSCIRPIFIASFLNLSVIKKRIKFLYFFKEIGTSCFIRLPNYFWSNHKLYRAQLDIVKILAVLLQREIELGDLPGHPCIRGLLSDLILAIRGNRNSTAELKKISKRIHPQLILLEKCVNRIDLPIGISEAEALFFIQELKFINQIFQSDNSNMSLLQVNEKRLTSFMKKYLKVDFLNALQQPRLIS